jgi:hypothetical protein
MYFDCSLVAGRKDSLSGENLWVSVLLGFVGLWRRKKMRAFGCFPFFGGELGYRFLNQYILIFMVSSNTKQPSFRSSSSSSSFGA